MVLLWFFAPILLRFCSGEMRLLCADFALISRPYKKRKYVRFCQVLDASSTVQYYRQARHKRTHKLAASSAFVATYAPGKQCTWLSTSMLPRLLGISPNPFLIAFAAAASGLSLPGAAFPDPPPLPSWLPPGLRGSGGGLLLLPSCLMVNFGQLSRGSLGVRCCSWLLPYKRKI